jgi:DNA repair protein RadA/Sms
MVRKMVNRQGKNSGIQIPLALRGFQCFECGEEYPQRVSVCPSCNGVHTMLALREAADGEQVTPAPARRARRASSIPALETSKISTGTEAWDIALDGGFVRPSSLLVCGDPGVGKSTQAIAIAGAIADLLDEPVLYGSAEMPDAMFAHIARNRLNMKESTLRKVFVTDTNDLDAMLADIEEIEPALVVWDSMQRFRYGGEEGDVVLRRVVHDGIQAAKDHDHIAMFISQVTKGDSFAGRNTIEHDVDVAIWLTVVTDGIAVQVPTKNRYGRTPLVGIIPVEWSIPIVEAKPKKRKPRTR